MEIQLHNQIVGFKLTTPTVFAKITPQPSTFYRVVFDDNGVQKEELYLGNVKIGGIDMGEPTEQEIQKLISEIYANV